MYLPRVVARPFPLLLLLLLALTGLVLPAQSDARTRPPVVMIVFDEFPVDAIRGPDGRIDAGRFPNLAELAGQSVWYPNNTTVADWTWRAAPSIMDGRWPRKGKGSRARGVPHSIFRLLARRGYAIRSTEEITSVCPYKSCIQIRDRGFTETIRSGRFARLNATIDSIGRGRRPTFYFHHTVLPHQPWVHLPSGKRHQKGIGDFGLSVTGPPGFDVDFLTKHSEQRFLLQMGAVDRVVGRLIARLRATGLYDKALVVLTADHGIAFETGVPDRRQVDRGILDSIATVPLIIKQPGQRVGVIDPSYIRSIDILPTVAGLLRIRVPWRVDGKPAWSRAVRKRRRVRLVLRHFDGVITMGAAELERRRRARIDKRLKTFGWGSWAPVYRIGPHRELLGRATRELSVSSAPRTRAQLRDAERLRSVKLRSGLIPSSIGGRILGRQRKGRDVAVALNGRIAATGRSFRLKGRPGERFSVMVPESSLRAGRNRLEVFEIRPGGRLLLLGRSL